ncbi:MAG: PTS glucitol/sorbitol transporter subunit IIB [Chloroflexi bacterium]|nr:PTS glucitol/sorbitol transporter subunit IIB [Chloroflexota bacterium]
MGAITNLLEKIGRGAGKVVGILYQAGRDSVDQIVTNILPFMAFIAMIIGIILKTGVGNILANTLSPLASSVPGLIFMSLIVGLPVLSPLLGPGAVIAQIIGTLLGVEIGRGNIPPQYALPALWAINPQVGCDFIPVGLSLGEAEPETVEVGVPAVLFSRFITGPIAVIIGWIASIGMYS